MNEYKVDIESFKTGFEFEDAFESFDEFAMAPEFELLYETTAARPSRAGEQYVDTSTWNANPLREHGGAGANVLLRWNDVPSETRLIDVVVHLHGYHGLPPNAQMLRAVAARSGLDLSERTRPTLAILPRGRRITPEEVRQTQARLNELASRSGKKPATARSDVYTFPALWRDGGAGLESLITEALQWFTRQRGGGAALPIARLILTAHSGGGAALDRLVVLHARRKVCNPDEVHVFDALYAQADGLKSWVSARLGADRGGAGYGGGLRVFYLHGGRTQHWSEHLAQSLPGRGHALSRRYRAECTRVGHLEIPNAFGPALLRDAAADLAALQPCSGRAPSKPAPSKSSRPRQSRAGTPARGGAGPRTPERAALPSDVAGWVRSTDRSALELIADAAQRRKLLQEVDWSREYFPGNPDAQQRPAAGRLAEELFQTMARVVPERRVPEHYAPSGIRYHDVTRVVAKVPGQPDYKLFPEARDAFVRMREAAAADGVQLQILSSWRSPARQQAARKQQANPKAVAQGISAHMYGLAVDLNMSVAGLPLVNVSTRAKDRMANMVRMYRSPNYKWLALNGSRFGWFPYQREPWHWEYNPPGFKERFEGSTAASREFEWEAFDDGFENTEGMDEAEIGKRTAPGDRDVGETLARAAKKLPGLGISLEELLLRHKTDFGGIPIEALLAFIHFEAGTRLFDDATAGKWSEKYRKYSPPFYELGLFQTPAGVHGCVREGGKKMCRYEVPGHNVEKSQFGKGWRRIRGVFPTQENWKDPAMQVRIGLWDLNSTGERVARDFPELFPSRQSEWYLRMAILYSFSKGAGWTRAYLSKYRNELLALPESRRWDFLRGKPASLKGRGTKPKFDPENVDKKIALAAKLRAVRGATVTPPVTKR